MGPRGHAAEARFANIYRAFNAREIDWLLAQMTADVDWPNAWEGGRAVGRGAVREYWTRQWASIDPRVEPERVLILPDARVQDFPVNGADAIRIVVRAPGTPSGSRTVAALAQSAAREAAGRARLVPARFLGRGVWQLELLPHGGDAAAANQRLVQRLRGLGEPPNFLVGGSTAAFVDQKAAISSHAPLALTILALITTGLLFI